MARHARLLGVFLATSTTALRWLLGFAASRRQLALSFGAALFVIAFVAPGIAELLRLRQEGVNRRRKLTPSRRRILTPLEVRSRT